MSKVSKIHGTDFNALNAMYVEDVGDGVCGFYATLYAEYTLYTVAPRPARREGSLQPSVLWVQRFTTKQSEEAALS